MLRVICIDASDREGCVAEIGFFIKEGEVYTVFDQWSNFWAGRMNYCYSLVEDPNRMNFGYETWRFVPLSEISETQMERNYDKIKILVK